MAPNLLLAATLFLSPALCLAGAPQTAYRIELPSKSSISVPADWVIQQGERRIKVVEYATQAVKSAGITSQQLAPVQQILVANYPNREKYAGLSITSEKNAGVTRNFVALMTKNDIAQTEIGLTSVIKNSMASVGISTKDWTPLTRVKVGTRDALKISCVRVSSMEDTRTTQYMFSGDGVVFTVTVSSVLSNEAEMASTLSRIVQSFAY